MEKPAPFTDKLLGKRLLSAVHSRKNGEDRVVLEFKDDNAERTYKMVVSSTASLQVTARALVPKPPRPRRL